MLTIACSFAHVTDEQLLTEVHSLVALERQATVRLIASLAELEIRGLHLRDGCSSLFTYCTQRLHLSEAEAYGRIAAARTARKWPLVLERLEDGSVTLTTVTLLAAHLTADNHRALLDAARHKGRREVEQQVAALRPLAVVPSTVRKLPAPKQAPTTKPENAAQGVGSFVAVATAVSALTAPIVSSPSAILPAVASPGASHRPAVVPLAPERFKVQFTISRETHDKLRRVQDLLRHSVADRDPAVVFERALSLLLAELERKKLAQTNRPQRPRPNQTASRHVPAAVKREVWTRDEGRCAFVGAGGRCAERGFLEFHHVIPFAEGGETTAGNLELRCRAHNAYEAAQHFGTLFVREEHGLYGPSDDNAGHRCGPSRRLCSDRVGVGCEFPQASHSAADRV